MQKINEIAEEKKENQWGKWFFEKIDKNDKWLARRNKVNAEKTQIADIKGQRGHYHTAPGTGRLRSGDKVMPLHSAAFVKQTVYSKDGHTTAPSKRARD